MWGWNQLKESAKQVGSIAKDYAKDLIEDQNETENPENTNQQKQQENNETPQQPQGSHPNEQQQSEIQPQQIKNSDLIKKYEKKIKDIYLEQQTQKEIANNLTNKLLLKQEEIQKNREIIEKQKRQIEEYAFDLQNKEFSFEKRNQEIKQYMLNIQNMQEQSAIMKSYHENTILEYQIQLDRIQNNYDEQKNLNQTLSARVEELVLSARVEELDKKISVLNVNQPYTSPDSQLQQIKYSSIDFYQQTQSHQMAIDPQCNQLDFSQQTQIDMKDQSEDVLQDIFDQKIFKDFLNLIVTNLFKILDIQESVKQKDCQFLNQKQLIVYYTLHFSEIYNIIQEKIVTKIDQIKKQEKIKQDKLQENNTKMLEEIKNNQKIEQELRKETQNQKQNLIYKEQISQKFQENIKQLEEERSNLNEQNKQKTEKIQSLVSKIKTFKQEGQEIKQYIDSLDQKCVLLQQEKENLQENQTQFIELKAQVEDKDFCIERLSNGLSNLQIVHEETLQRQQQCMQQSEIKFLECMQKQDILIQNMTDYSILQDLMKEKIIIIEEQKQQYENLEQKFLKLENENNTVKIETTALIRKIQQEHIFNEQWVDKRIITNFLVQYFDNQTSYEVKLQILETLSNILNFQESERIKMGLHKQLLKINMRRTNNDKIKVKTLQDQFIDFITKMEEEKQ